MKLRTLRAALTACVSVRAQSDKKQVSRIAAGVVVSHFGPPKPNSRSQFRITLIRVSGADPPGSWEMRKRFPSGAASYRDSGRCSSRRRGEETESSGVLVTETS